MSLHNQIYDAQDMARTSYTTYQKREGELTNEFNTMADHCNRRTYHIIGDYRVARKLYKEKIR